MQYSVGIITPIGRLMNTGNYFVNSNTVAYSAQFMITRMGMGLYQK